VSFLHILPVIGIQSCVRAVLQRSMPKLAVLSGGHSHNCFPDDALVIDMSKWNQVQVFRDQSAGYDTVVAGGGATIGSITAVCEAQGLVVPLGDRPSVGMGLVLQGGINHFMRRFGLAIDNLVRVVYVSPKGELCDATTQEDLWAFRGAGPNFGVVLRLHLRAYKVATVVTATSEYNIIDPNAEHTNDDAVVTALQLYKKVTTTSLLSRSHALDGYLFWSSHCCLCLGTAFFGCGNENETVQELNVVGKLHSVMDAVLGPPHKRMEPSVVTPSQLFDKELYMTPSFAAKMVLSPDGFLGTTKLRSIKQCVFLVDMCYSVTQILTTAIRDAPTKWCYVHLMQGGGKVCEIPSTASAFGCRDWLYAAILTGRYHDNDDNNDDDNANSVGTWLQKVVGQLLPYSNGIYSTDLGPHDWILAQHAFGRNSLALANRKRHDDPGNILCCTCPLLLSSFSSLQQHCCFDPRFSNRGVVLLLCGRRFAGKDWLAERIIRSLRMLLSSSNTRATTATTTGISLVHRRISDAIKREFAEEQVGLLGSEDLIEHRAVKESYRAALTEYYHEKRELMPFLDRQYLLEAMDDDDDNNNNNNNGGMITIITGVREGLEEARTLAEGKPVIMIHVTANDESKRCRGWRGGPFDSIDQSAGEQAAEQVSMSFEWDLTYENNSCAVDPS
jgi:hypothetical protein